MKGTKKTKRKRRFLHRVADRRPDPAAVTRMDALELLVRELAADVQDLTKRVGAVVDQSTRVAALEDALTEAIRFGREMVDSSDEIAGEDMADERAEYHAIIEHWEKVRGPYRAACTFSRGECPEHKVEHGREAEELRAGIEKVLVDTNDDNDAVMDLRVKLRALLDEVDARDSLAFREAAS